MVCYLSEYAPEVLTTYIKNSGYKIKYIYDNINSPTGDHPDLYMCKLGFLPTAPVFHGDIKKLNNKYPEDAIYNAACTDRFFIHNLKITFPSLLSKLGIKNATHTSPPKDPEIVPVMVKQGYSKCNVCIVDEYSIITEDVGIAKACEKAGLNILLISRGHVRLSEFEYGFMGGATGHLGDRILFNGNLLNHPDCEEIISFIKTRNLDIVYFEEYPLTDIGSIIIEA